MEQTTGRRRVARIYVALIALTPLTVIAQGILFAAFYSEGGKRGYRDRLHLAKGQLCKRYTPRPSILISRDPSVLGRLGP